MYLTFLFIFAEESTYLIYRDTVLWQLFIVETSKLKQILIICVSLPLLLNIAPTGMLHSYNRLHATRIQCSGSRSLWRKQNYLFTFFVGKLPSPQNCLIVYIFLRSMDNTAAITLLRRDSDLIFSWCPIVYIIGTIGLVSING